MSQVKNFKELQCWQISKVLSLKIYVLTKEDPVRKDFEFVSQIRRAALSIMNNIAEGFGRFRKREFARFLDFSLGSCYEVESMLDIGLELAYFDKKDAQEMTEKCIIIKKMLISLKSYLLKNLN